LGKANQGTLRELDLQHANYTVVFASLYYLAECAVLSQNGLQKGLCSEKFRITLLLLLLLCFMGENSKMQVTTKLFLHFSFYVSENRPLK